MGALHWPGWLILGEWEMTADVAERLDVCRGFVSQSDGRRFLSEFFGHEWDPKPFGWERLWIR